MEVREILGLDVGLKMTGIARASNVALLAEPLVSVKTDKALDSLSKIIKTKQVEAVAVGLPRNLSGEDTGQTAWIREWVVNAKQKVDVPFYWQDEALTSREAAKVQKTKFKKQSVDEHALSAAIILQDFLDTPETERIVC